MRTFARKRWWERWDEFFFAERDCEFLGLIRIVFGSYLLYTYFQLTPDAMAIWGHHSLIGRLAAEKYVLHAHPPSIFQFFADTDAGQTAALHLNAALFLISATLLTIGLFTRAATLVVILAHMSFHLRNPTLASAGDFLTRELLVLMLFAPLGRCWSVSAWWRRPQSTKASRWAIRLVQLQISALYLCTVVWKWHGQLWRHGLAVYYVSRSATFYNHSFPFVFDDLVTIKILTWGTLCVESAMGVLIWWPRHRLWMVGTGIVFHLILRYTLDIPRFQPVMIIGLLCFVETEDFSVVIHWLRTNRLWPVSKVADRGSELGTGGCVYRTQSGPQ